MDIEKIIDKILWGRSIVTVANGDDQQLKFILRSLNIKEVNYTNYIYDAEYESAINNGVLSNDDLVRVYQADGVWGEEQEEKVKHLERQSRIVSNQIKNAEMFPTRLKKLRRDFKKIQEEIEYYHNLKFSLFTLSAENRAEEIKRRYTVMFATEDMQEKRYWDDEETFLTEADYILIYNLAYAYYKNNFFDIKTLRKVARSPSWRFRWGVGRKGGDIFGKPISEWSEMQSMLVYWSQYYDGIFESPDRPSDFVIENDEACDSWVEEQNKKHSKGSSEGKNIYGTKRAKATKDHQEQFIMVEPGNEDVIKRVQEENSKSVRDELKKKFDIIKKSKGRVKEWDLKQKLHR